MATAAYKREWRAKKKAKKEADFADLSKFWVPLPPDSKKCKRCATLKPFSEFYKQSDKPNGMASHCKPCASEKHKEANKHNKEKRKITTSKYKKENREKIREADRIYTAKKRKEDPIFNIKSALRARIVSVLGYKKTKQSIEYIGCTLDEYKVYLESKFQHGMTWENRGRFGWHIDHIRPLSSFDLSDPAEIEKAFHYTNTQPLWWIDNLKKSDKVDYV
jgi:hypothetical protein